MSSSLSAAERTYIATGVAADVRGDGRARHGMRRLRVTTGVLPHAHGSARASLGGAGGTEVLVSVKAELVGVDAARPREGRVECAAQVAAGAAGGCSGRGSGGSSLAGDVAATLQRLLGARGAVDVAGLCVVPALWCWCVHVDAVVLASAGSVVDVAAAATVAALRATRLPRLRVVSNGGGAGGAGNGTAGVELALDDEPGAFVPFPGGADLPTSITVHLLGGCAILDASAEEEACSDSSVTVGVDRTGRVCTFTTQGRVGISPAALHEAIAAARCVAPAVLRTLDEPATSGGLLD